MIQFGAIRSAIVRGLSAHLKIKVIEMNVAANEPPYPFLAYDFTDLGDTEGGLPVEYVINGTIKTVEAELFTVSFLSYADSKVESVENALRSRDWFLTAGHSALKEAVNVVVVNVATVTNRDVQLGIGWERRNGFEVDFRATNVIEVSDKSADFIETAIVKERGNE